MNIGKGGTHNSTTLIEVYKYLLNIFFNKLTRAQKKVKVLKKKELFLLVGDIFMLISWVTFWVSTRQWMCQNFSLSRF